MASEGAVRAAGAVLWKPSSRHGFKIAVVHRPSYDDWSLPKGKADGAESAPQTAAREVLEETGYHAAIGRAVTAVSYEVSAGTKTVQYFSARRLHGGFVPNKEVDALEWLAADEAADRMTYDFDRVVLENFLTHRTPLRTVLVVRHAKAGSRESFDGDDARRPLDGKGRKQARALQDLLAPFRPRRVLSAPVLRCRQTVQPLAHSLALPIDTEPELAEDTYRSDPAAARKLIAGLAVTGPDTPDGDEGCTVVCSQGGVIPGVIKALASRADIRVPDAGTPKASHWVLSFAEDHLAQADFYPAPKV